jgi:hypothetical protein
VVRDANGQSLAYVYSRPKPEDARTAGVLTEDEARRIATNIAKLPTHCSARISRLQGRRQLSAQWEGWSRAAARHCNIRQWSRLSEA